MDIPITLAKKARDANLDILAEMSARLEREGTEANSEHLSESKAFTVDELKDLSRNSLYGLEKVALLKSHGLVKEILGGADAPQILWMSFALDNLRFSTNIEPASLESNHDFGLSHTVFLSTRISPGIPTKIPSITREVVRQYLKRSKKDEQSCRGVCLTKEKILGFEDAECGAIYMENGHFVCWPTDEVVTPATKIWDEELKDGKWDFYLASFAALVPAVQKIKFLMSATSFFNSLHQTDRKAAAQLIVAIDGIPTLERAEHIYHLLQIVLSGIPMAWSATTKLAKDRDEIFRQVQDLKKYRETLNLLQRPLDHLTESAHSMQEHVRSLSAVLYEPAEGLFQAHKSIVDLFEEGKTIELPPSVRIKVKHGSKAYTKEEAVLILAIAACKIFGVSVKLPDWVERVKDEKPKVLRVLRQLLLDHLSHHFDVYGRLAEDVLCVCFGGAEITLSKDCLAERENGFAKLFSLTDQYNTSPNDRVQFLKYVLFDPFKLEQTRGWHPLALKVALRHFRGSEPNEDVNFGLANENVLSFSERESTVMNIPSNYTPVGYSVVLDFLLKCCSYYRNRDSGARGRLAKVRIQPMRDCKKNPELKISLYFAGEAFLTEETGPGGSRLHALLHDHLLRLPRDWRVDHITIGNFQKPFVDLCNKVLGLAAEKGAGWYAERITHENNGPYRLLLLKRQMMVGSKEKTRCFELGLGSEVNDPGISLHWYEEVDGAVEIL